MKTAGEVMGHPLWILPVMMLAFLLLIEGLHTSAHLHQEIDVHGICRRNKEFIKMQEMQEDDY
mgnify:CR=1 FL=1|tara:strand:+ start:28 stop:216 length:189 start_codon:yes stop_codon:yes gene_type:complete